MEGRSPARVAPSRRSRLALTALIAATLCGCASDPTTGRAQATTAPDPLTMPLGCDHRSAQKQASVRALAKRAERAVEARHTARLDAIDAGTSASDDRDAALDAAMADYFHDQRVILAPLAAEGDFGALKKLAHAYRDRDDADGVRAWFRLTQCAADAGDPFANDELARWYWHQIGDGSLEDLQKNRALALDHAERSGRWSRIAIYIAGNVHQYPANPALAGEMLEVCARAGHADCQAELGLYPTYPWRTEGATRLFYARQAGLRRKGDDALQSDRLWAQATASARAGAEALAASWRPTGEAETLAAWATLRERILQHGAAYPMPTAPCTTATPWCRGRHLAR